MRTPTTLPHRSTEGPRALMAAPSKKKQKNERAIWILVEHFRYSLSLGEDIWGIQTKFLFLQAEKIK